MVRAESLITKQNVPLRQNSALFNKWSNAATSFDDLFKFAIILLIFRTFVLCLLFVFFVLGNLSLIIKHDTTMLSNDSPPFSNKTRIRLLIEYSNGSTAELGIANKIAQLTFEKLKTDLQTKRDDVKLVFEILIRLFVFSAPLLILHKLERHFLSNRAFISVGPYSTPASRRFLAANISICVILLFLSKFHPVVCIDSIIFVPLRIVLSYRYSHCRAAYFDLISRYSQYEVKEQTINASELNKQIFLRNAVRKELIAKTSKLTDVICVKEPVNLTFVVKGLLLEECEENGQMDTTEAVIELKRYKQYCDLYGSICADKELTIAKDPTIDNNKKPTDPVSSTSDLLSHVL